jgi:hypothetical protein
MDKNKKDNKNRNNDVSFSNDQLGENEIDKDMAEDYKELSNKKKKK